MDTTTHTVTFLALTPSTCTDTPGAYDVQLLLDEVECEATLIPDNDGDLATWGGSLDYWADPKLTQALLDMNVDDRREVIGDIETLAQAALERSATAKERA